MIQENDGRVLSAEGIDIYMRHLREQERSAATISKYACDLEMVRRHFAGKELTKDALIHWKEGLKEKYAATSVNTMIAALNGFLKFMEWFDLIVKPVKIQKSSFCDESKELTCEEYRRLVKAAETDGNRRLSLVVQTICSMGIRVSELRFVTAEAVRTGWAVVDNKGKCRKVALPQKLRRSLSKYMKERQITAGPVFITKNGKPLNRSNIWRDMKKLCESAGVAPDKVFPHNLRHLFARTYYSIHKDISRLADILGHSNVNTTRIYTMESGAVHARQIEALALVIT